ncbi:MAG TPA: ABC transporter permease [Puia sp.]|jgi:ABC-type antimicrobial peptide transport system permease subunit
MKKYFLTGIRSIRQRPGYTVINVLGLSLGIAACLVIFLVVRYELSYDSFNHKAKRIYRVNLHALDFNPGTSPVVTPAMRNDFPELEQVAELIYVDEGVVKVGNNQYDEKGYAFADANIPQVFDYQWIAGDARTALSAPNSVVLTESMAHKYFGTTDAMGQVIEIDKKYTCKVTGITKDLPGNTSVPTIFLISLETMRKDLAGITNFYSIIGGNFTFIVTRENYPIEKVRSRIHGFIEKNWGKDMAKEATLVLQPLLEVHFDQRYLDITMSPTTSRETYWALAGIALFIIITACINFINLSTGLALTRAKEVGVRKVLGASRPQLISQFMGETTILVLLALLLGLLATVLLLPGLRTWLDIRVSVAELREPMVMGILAAMVIVVILLAGLYPAFFQSAFQPVISLKGTRTVSWRGFTLRKSLVVLQFAISQLLIIGTIVVARQMDYFQNRDLGFNKESVITFPVPDSSRRALLKPELMANPNITAISFSNGAPSYNSNFAPFSCPSRGITKDDVTELKAIDENYTRMFGLKTLAGDTISPRPLGDTVMQVVVNEMLINKLGFPSAQAAVGQRFLIGRSPVSILGVIQDFQSESKHKKRRPCILFYRDRGVGMTSVRIRPQAIRQTLASIEKAWSVLYPGDLFQYEFIDDHIAGLYRQEQKVYTAFRFFSFIAILIGCLGLYGLVAFAAVQRTREVGIRKVLGASLGSILYMFSRDFVVLILVAFFIAGPVAWMVMHRWLESFAYRVGIGWGTFVLSVAASFIIAGITISYESIKAAIVPPVKSLRSE